SHRSLRCRQRSARLTPGGCRMERREPPVRTPSVSPTRRPTAAAPPVTSQMDNVDRRLTCSSCSATSCSATSSAGVIGFPPPSLVLDRLRAGGLGRWCDKCWLIVAGGRLLSATWRRWQHLESALPDRSAVELDRHPVWRIDCALVCAV